MKLASIASVALALPGLVDIPGSAPEVNDQHLIAHAELEARRDLFDVAVWTKEMERQWYEAVTPDPAPKPRASTPSTGRCGGDLPDCSIMECESGGSLTAQNPGSSASGKWQMIDSTWGNFMGYPSAADAPEEVQDAKARELWRGGAGRGHWEQCL